MPSKAEVLETLESIYEQVGSILGYLDSDDDQDNQDEDEE